MVKITIDNSSTTIRTTVDTFDIRTSDAVYEYNADTGYVKTSDGAEG